MKKKIGVKLADISPLEYYDGLRLPTFVIASDNDEMIQLEEMEHLFRNIKSKLKKFRIARGTHSEERPYSLMKQCFDFTELVFRIQNKNESNRGNLDYTNTHRDNFKTERWANNVSEMHEDPKFNQFNEDTDPWAKEKCTYMNNEESQNVISPKNIEPYNPRTHVAKRIRPPRTPEVHKVEVTTQEMMHAGDGGQLGDKESERSLAQSRQHYSTMLDAQQLKLQSRSHSRSRTPSNVRIKKTPLGSHNDHSSMKSDGREIHKHFMDVESDEEFKPVN